DAQAERPDAARAFAAQRRHEAQALLAIRAAALQVAGQARALDLDVEERDAGEGEERSARAEDADGGARDAARVRPDPVHERFFEVEADDESEHAPQRPAAVARVAVRGVRAQEEARDEEDGAAQVRDDALGNGRRERAEHEAAVARERDAQRHEGSVAGAARERARREALERVELAIQPREARAAQRSTPLARSAWSGARLG